eukprot:Colp12_sorted_trinity150504_noHs@22487
MASELKNGVYFDSSQFSNMQAQYGTVAVVMVGLPGRGKTYMAKKLCRYMKWLGIQSAVFNVADYRRDSAGAKQPTHFFDPENEEGESLRLQSAQKALDDMLDWFKVKNNMVGIYDAANTTRERRRWVYDRLKAANIQAFFIEVMCDQPHLINQHIKEQMVSSPDFKDMPPETVLEDFAVRIAHYQKRYEPLDIVYDKEWSFVKSVNVGENFIVNRGHGYIQSRMIYYIMNMHIAPRAIYITRHGESEYNVVGRIGGDSDLSGRGQQFAFKLSEFIKQQGPSDLKIWTSTLKRTMQTAGHLGGSQIRWKALDEIDAGVCDGMTYEEIQELYPAEFAARDEDKFNYRYPRGESYRDLVQRLEPVIMELERQSNVLVIGHQAVLRCILAYFMDRNSEELAYINVPLHTVVKITPIAYGCRWEEFPLPVPAVSTQREKPAHTHPQRTPQEALATVPPHS